MAGCFLLLFDTVAHPRGSQKSSIASRLVATAKKRLDRIKNKTPLMQVRALFSRRISSEHGTDGVIGGPEPMTRIPSPNVRGQSRAGC